MVVEPWDKGLNCIDALIDGTAATGLGAEFLKKLPGGLRYDPPLKILHDLFVDILTELCKVK
jgi:hypothetical protein